MGTIEAICISKKKGVPKKPVLSALLVKNQGIEGDAHAGSGHRQVSLLAGESIDRMREKLPQLADGAFAENIVTRGIDLKSVSVGERITINNHLLLEVTQIGKECHTACAIKTATGDCIMPKEGIFTRVITGGEIRPGDRVAVEIIN